MLCSMRSATHGSARTGYSTVGKFAMSNLSLQLITLPWYRGSGGHNGFISRMRRSERSQTRLFRDTSLMVYITGAGACAPISAEILRLPVFEPVSFPCRRCFAGVHTSLARSSLIRSSADHNLGITATRSSVGLGWLAYSVMRSVTAHGFHCTRMEVSPREVRLQRFVPAGGPSLRMLVVPHLGIHMLFCRLLAQLYVSVGIRSLAIGLGSRSELAPRPLALKRPAIEHPTFQSLLPVPG